MKVFLLHNGILKGSIYYRWVFVVGIFLYTLTLTAQSVDEKFRKADVAFANEDYETALTLYKDIASKPEGRQNAIVHFKLGISYLFRFDPATGLGHILKAHEIDSVVNYTYWYWLGRAYHLDLQFSKALRSYRKCLETVPEKDDLREASRKHIAQIHSGRAYFKDPLPFLVTNMGEKVNTPYSEHSPITNNDGSLLVFTSRRPLVANEPIAADGFYFEKIFISDLDSAGVPLNVKSINADFNVTAKDHYATIQILEDGKKLILYKSGKFFSSELVNGKWSAPARLEKDLGPKILKSDVFYNYDADTIYYADRAKGREDLDIYVAYKVNGKWKSHGINGLVNSEEDDRAPILLNDSTLVFASKGHSSIGGFDLFVSHFNRASNSWNSPENLGAPINSSYDDIYYYPHPDRTTVYISSQRPHNYGNGDIFRVTPASQATYKGNLISQMGRKLNEFKVVFYDTESPVSSITIQSDSTTGTYQAKLISGRTYYVYPIRDNDTLGVEGGNSIVPPKPNVSNPKPTVKRDIVVMLPEEQKVVAQQTVVPVNTNDTSSVANPNPEANANPIVKADDKAVASNGGWTLELDGLRSLYFGYKESDLTPNSKIILDLLATYLTAAPEAKLDIDGHADNIGGPAYNKQLAERRAESVKQYLVQKGVPANNLKTTSYGSEKPAANNATADGRELNRRVEVSVALPGQKPTSTIKVVVKQTNPFDMLKPISFDYNKSTLAPPVTAILGAYLQILKQNLGLNVTVTGHTDNVGSEVYNQTLSEKRAASVRDYFANNGIPKSTINSDGKGELVPIAPNTTPKGRAQNRRVEFKPTKTVTAGK